MKLYYSPGACSLSPHIIIKEAGLQVALEKVALATKKTESGTDYTTINKKGQIPTLQLDNGQILTEGPVIVQYLADLVPDRNLIPKYGTMERYRVMEWLNFISSELHKRWSPLFRKPSDEIRKSVNEELVKKLAVLEETLTKSDFLMGKTFTVADAYLFTVLNWAKGTHVELPGFLSAYVERVSSRPSVKQAMQDEGLKT